jgi:hypothetical protein
MVNSKRAGKLLQPWDSAMNLKQSIGMGMDRGIDIGNILQAELVGQVTLWTVG